MKIQQLRQILREEIKPGKNIKKSLIENIIQSIIDKELYEAVIKQYTESNIKKEPGKYTLKKGNEVATFTYSKLTKEWYGKLTRGGKSIYEEFRQGYDFVDNLGVKVRKQGSLPYEKWKEMGLGLLGELYEKIKNNISQSNWNQLNI
jgi:putative IMPACT (imprinted ancient) family translation regulator